MKVRITDLLDDYYDKSVRLDSPEELLRQEARDAGFTTPPDEETHRFGLRQLLTVAAALMLVLMGGVVLYLRMGIQPAGKSLDGENASWQENDPETEVNVPVDPTPEQEAAAAAPQEPEVIEVEPSFENYSFIQRGSALEFHCAVSGVPGEFVGPTAWEDGQVLAQVNSCFPEAVAYYPDGELSLDEAVDYITLSPEGYDEATQTLYLSGTADLEAYLSSAEYQAAYPDDITYPDDIRYFDFYVRLWNQDRSRVLLCQWNRYGTLHLAPLDSFSQGRGERNPYMFSDSDFYGISRVTVTYEGVELQVSPVGLLEEGHTQEEIQAFHDSINEVVESRINNGLLVAYLDKGAVVLDGLILEKSGEYGNYYDGTWEYVWDPDRDTAIDPLAIELIEIEPMPIPMEEAVDLTGMGVLTTDGLDFLISNEEGTIIGSVARLEIDMTSGEYIWYLDFPELAAQLPEANQNGFDQMLHDDEFFYIDHLVYGNYALEQCLQYAEIFFNDGSSFILGSGNANGFDTGLFTSYGMLSSAAEDHGLDITGLIPVYVEIDRERFDLH